MGKSKPIHILAFLSVLFLTFGCNDLDDNEKVDLTREVIKQDSEIFKLLIKVSTSGDDPAEDEVCIDFIYPFKLFVYDANLLPQGEVILVSDDQFSSFLESLPIDQSISISYPLQTTLPDGTVFSVNNNTELKIALDSCSREDIIAHCNGIFKDNGGTCVWKVPFIENGNNLFAGAVFSIDDNATITLYHLNTTYQGTWVFLFLNDKLHLNINLSGTSSVVQNWNYNFLITGLSDNEIQMTTPTLNRKLIKTCETSIYTLGSIGPKGGLIAYDKGIYSNGWRFMEVAQEDSITEEWGCISSDVTNAQFNQVGTGYQNSVAIVNFHNQLNNYYLNPPICNSSNNGSVAAKTVVGLIQSQANDWCIPSIGELQLIYTNLHANGLGTMNNANYWSSSQQSITQAKCVNFSNGQLVNMNKNSGFAKTRMIRLF